MTRFIAEFVCRLPDGRFVTATQLLSLFNIYRDKERYSRYLLVPKSDEGTLKGVIVLGNDKCVRPIRKHGWPDSLYFKLLDLINNKNLKNRFEKIGFLNEKSDVTNAISCGIVKFFPNIQKEIPNEL